MSIPSSEPKNAESELTHFDSGGKAKMVDISEKPVSAREAVAQGLLRMNAKTRALIEKNALAKGDALAVARVAAIMAAKRTDELIPLCHSLPLSSVQIDFTFVDEGLQIIATARTTAQTGVEMEALTAVSVAALTVYDMAKAADKGMAITEIYLVSKKGGVSGDFVAPCRQSE